MERPSEQYPDRWHALLGQWGRDLQLWLFIVISLQLFRLLLISTFHEQLAPSSDSVTLLKVLGMGLRYDIAIAAVWVLPVVLAALLLALARPSALAWVRRLRLTFAYFYLLIGVPLIGADMVFFYVYGDQFDIHIFGIIHDDTRAVLITIWKEYHPIVFTVLLAVVIWPLWRLLRRWLEFTPQWSGRLPRHSLSLLMLFIFFTAMARGGTLWGEPMRLKHAFVVEDMYLNRTVLNPFSALFYTVKARLELETGSALKHIWPEGNLRSALATVRKERGLPHYAGDNIAEGLSSEARGHGKRRPRHIFLLLMESHSGWVLMPPYRELGFSPGLQPLAEKGLYFPNFLPASSGTIGSMNALVTGFPDAGLNINYETSATRPYPGSIATLFQRMGYTTRFYYGGYLSWQRLDSFAQRQGFDEIYGGGHMGADGSGTNEWGVDDARLFDFILENLDDEKPSFNLILTTSNHPPYDLDLDALGFPIKALPEPLKATKPGTLEVLGHLWYTDREAGRFVREAEKRLPGTLFALTGDHTARLSINFPGDDLAQHNAVPFILYGPEFLDESGIRDAPGSHIDIIPTLVELSAEKGFRYSHYGVDLLNTERKSALGWQYLIGRDFIATDRERYRHYALAGQKRPIRPELKEERKRFRALKALSWWQIKRGERLSD